MKIVINGVTLTVVKGTSLNLSNGVIEINTSGKAKKVTTTTVKETSSVAERCRTAFKNKSKGSTVIISANTSDAIRQAFKKIGSRVSIRATESATEFLVKRV